MTDLAALKQAHTKRWVQAKLTVRAPAHMPVRNLFRQTPSIATEPAIRLGCLDRPPGGLALPTEGI